MTNSRQRPIYALSGELLCYYNPDECTPREAVENELIFVKSVIWQRMDDLEARIDALLARVNHLQLEMVRSKGACFE